MSRLAAALALALAAGEARAQAVPVTPDLKDLQYARNVGMGGAYEALGYGAEAIGGNPAAISLFKRYTIEAAGTWDVPHGDGNFTLGVLDATSSVAAGLSYHYVTYGGADSRRFAHVTTLALSVPILSMIHLGVAGRHQVLLGATSTNSVTVNAGLVFRPADWLSLGFSGHNLIGVASVDVRRYVVASVSSLLFGQLTPAFDLRMDFNQPSTRFAYLGGVEWLIGNTFPVRGGYEYDGIADGLGRRQYVSFGLGYFSNGSGLDVAYRHELGGADGRVLAVSLKLQVN